MKRKAPKPNLEKLRRQAEAGCRQASGRLQAELLEIGGALAASPARRERLEAEDLCQQAGLYALEAWRSYDPQGRLDFRSYLLLKVKQGLAEYCARQRPLHGHYLGLPRSVWRDLKKLSGAEIRKAGREAIAEESRLSGERVRALQGLRQLKGDRSEVPPEPWEQVLQREQAEALHEAVRDLPRGHREGLSDPRRRHKALAQLSAHPRLRSLQLGVGFACLSVPGF